jgi:thioredoxin reductase/NAD-dependent dihydropyrimidine dehydrogenase PreA subunit
MEMNYFFIYFSVFLLIIILYARHQRKFHKTHSVDIAEVIKGNLGEPISLHPVIDPTLCIGSGTCVAACPEEAIGMLNGKMILKNPAVCIGHGACAAACPVEAIRLVYGSEKRGIDIPNVKPNFETNVPGIFIAGELGGMGLIRKAAEQGRQAIASIRKRKTSDKADFDVVIIGCGPAGLSAGLSAIHHKMRYKLIEQEESLGGAVFQYPRQKIAMTQPIELDIIGKVSFTEIQKEKLIEFWIDVVKKTGLKISFRERMVSIDKTDGHFTVRTNRGNYICNSVLLSMGRRGTPRKLEVPGELTSKVTYRLIDPEQYKGQSVLVVGGGDSALEAAITLSKEPGTRVTLSYRSSAFSRVKPKNRNELEKRQLANRLRVLMESNVKSIDPDHVSIEVKGKIENIPNQAVIVCAGGLLPTPILQKIGIEFETKYGTA